MTLPTFKIENKREYEILNKFFRICFTQEEFGYVLEGIKPISIRNYCYPANIQPCANIFYTENEILRSLLLFEAIPTIKRMAPYEKDLVLKIAPLNLLGANHLGVEVQFIHVPALTKAIEENISLFKYILGPLVTTKDLVQRIAFSDESFFDILLENHVLIGIVLGYGTYNSLMGGRSDQVDFLSISRDMAPFASKSLTLNDQKECYSWHYLNAIGGNDTLMSFRVDDAPLVPNQRFPTIIDEINAIGQLDESLPSCLYKEPAFIFGAYKGGPSNHPLFDRLIKAQKNIQLLLQHDNFLDNVLTKILGQNPSICCTRSDSAAIDAAFFKGTIGIKGWEQILLQVADNLDDDEKKTRFFNSFFDPPKQPRQPASLASSKFTRDGLKIALENLSLSKKYFASLDKDSSLSTVVKNQLYFRTLKFGSGLEWTGFDRIKINYHIKDLNQNILSANYHTWLSASQLILGFSHGIKGMRMGEIREIFIHPSLAYGVMTTLPPCMGLISHVELLDFDKKDSKSVPPLKNVDCNWIEDPKLLEEIEQSIENKPIFLSWFYRTLFDKIEGKDAKNMITQLKPYFAPLYKGGSDRDR